MVKKGFTLIELLVVIAIIGLLSSVAIVSMGSSREKARVAAQIQYDQSIEHKLGYESVGSWPLDEGSGTAISDATGPGNNGVLSAADGSTWVTGVKGKAVYFNGTNYVTMTKSISLPMDNFTVTAWFKTTNQNDGKVFSTSTSHLQLSIYGGGSLRICITSCTYGPRNYADGLWHFAVATGDATSIRGYIDGRLETEQATSSAIMVGIPRIGAHGAGDGGQPPAGPFTGSIDEVKAYAETTTAIRIREMYHAGLAGHPNPLAVR